MAAPRLKDQSTVEVRRRRRDQDELSYEDEEKAQRCDLVRSLHWRFQKTR
jgi:hypothetical protein